MVDALLGEKVAVGVVASWTEIHADMGIRVTIEDRVYAADGHTEMKQGVGKFPTWTGQDTPPGRIVTEISIWAGGDTCP